jgi:hypothetical protein
LISIDRKKGEIIPKEKTAFIKAGSKTKKMTHFRSWKTFSMV